MTLRFSKKTKIFHSYFQRGGAFEVMIVLAGMYWVSFVHYVPLLMAPGNVWSQMEFSIELNLCVSQRALGTSSTIVYRERKI